MFNSTPRSASIFSAKPEASQPIAVPSPLSKPSSLITTVPNSLYSPLMSSTRPEKAVDSPASTLSLSHDSEGAGSPLSTEHAVELVKLGPVSGSKEIPVHYNRDRCYAVDFTHEYDPMKAMFASLTLMREDRRNGPGGIPTVP